jgi:hypothetical protein
MNETKRIFRWFWAWNDEQEEAWLTEMARQGWHLREPGVFGFYTFERGAPRNVVYRLDFKTAGRDKAEYLQLFADAGWEHVGEMGGWQYFRTEAPEGEAPEIYTDKSSKIHKYQRLLLFLVIFLPIYSVTLNNVGRGSSGLLKALSLVFALFMVLYAYALVRIFLRILQLRK